MSRQPPRPILGVSDTRDRSGTFHCYPESTDVPVSTVEKQITARYLHALCKPDRLMIPAVKSGRYVRAPYLSLVAAGDKALMMLQIDWICLHRFINLEW